GAPVVGCGRGIYGRRIGRRGVGIKRGGEFDVQIDEVARDRLALELRCGRAVPDDAAAFAPVVARTHAAVIEEQQPALVRQLARDITQSGRLREVDLREEAKG